MKGKEHHVTLKVQLVQYIKYLETRAGDCKGEMRQDESRGKEINFLN